MPRENRAVVGMLLSFVAGGLFAGVVIPIGRTLQTTPSAAQAADASGGQPQPPPGTPPSPWLIGTLDEQVRNLFAYLQAPDQVPLPPDTTDADPKQPEPKTMLIEPGELQKKLRQPGLRILDTRLEAEYVKGHVPGAVWVDVKSWQALGRREGGFHDAEAWGEKVSRLGISRESQVVVYGSSLPDAARIWWTLKYLGLQSVAIVDGGWQRWVDEGQPIDAAVPAVEVVSFEPEFQADRLEEIDSLKKSVHSGDVTVVDARSAEEFSGKEVRGKRGGHIPGAKHLEWKDLLAEDGRFKSVQALQELFRERGILPEQTAVTC